MESKHSQTKLQLRVTWKESKIPFSYCNAADNLLLLFYDYSVDKVN